MRLPKHGRHVLHLYGYGFLIKRRLQKIDDTPDHAFFYHQQFHAERFLRYLPPVLMPVNAVCLKDRRAVSMVQAGVADNLCCLQRADFLPPAVLVIESAIQRVLLHNVPPVYELMILRLVLLNQITKKESRAGWTA